MTFKLVCQLNDDGVFVGMTKAFECQIVKGVFHIPAGALDVEPPEVSNNQYAVWHDKWVLHTKTPAVQNETQMSEESKRPILSQPISVGAQDL
jgi:hypothetical protein